MTPRLGLWLCAGILLTGCAACLIAALLARRDMTRSQKNKHKQQRAKVMRTYAASAAVLGVCAVFCMLCIALPAWGVFSRERDSDATEHDIAEGAASSEDLETTQEPELEEGTLAYACSEKDIHAVQALLNAGNDVSARVNGRTALMYACRYRDGADNTQAAAIAALLLEAGAEVDETDDDGRTALMYAAVSDEMTAAVRLLLDAGADIDRLAGDATALTYAVSGGAIDNVTLLLQRGADITGVRNPLREAVYPTMSFARRDVLTALVQAGADTNITISLTNPANGTKKEYSLRECIEMDREDYITAGRPIYDFGWEGSDWSENYRLILEMPAFS